MEQFFDKTAKIFRVSETLGQYNRPTNVRNLLGTVDGMLKRVSNYSTQLNPQKKARAGYRFYTIPTADVQTGDYLEINGMTYIADIPYRLPDHMEIDLLLDIEV